MKRKEDSPEKPGKGTDPKGSGRRTEQATPDTVESYRSGEFVYFEKERESVLSRLAVLLSNRFEPKEISARILNLAKKLTDSRHGYVGLIDPHSGDLVAGLITKAGWDHCPAQDKKKAFAENHGLRVLALREGKSVLINSPLDGFHAKGIPRHQPPLKRLLSVPALAQGRVIGQVAVADSERDYDQHDLETIERLADIFSLALQGELREEELASSRDRAEKALEESEERFHMVADFIYDWENWTDQHGDLVYVSPSCERITGFRPEEFMARPSLHQEIVHPYDRKVYLDHHMRYIPDTENSAKLVFRIITRQGKERWISHKCIPVFGDNGQFRGRRNSNRDITEHKKVEQALLQYQERLRSLAVQLTLSEEKESRRIASDLHDRIGQSLALTQIKLEQARSKTREPNLGKVLDTAIGLLKSSIQEVRTLTFEISPQTLYEIGLSEALKELAGQYQKEYGIRFRFEDDGLPKPLSNNIRAAAYRAAREVIINVIKHARAEKITLTLKRKGRNMLIVITDDGQGFDLNKMDQEAQKSRSYGLFSLRERIMYLGGKVDLESQPGKGTRVSLTVPLDNGP